MGYGKFFYEDFFRENAGKLVRVEMTDGDVLEGKLDGHISALDNEPDPESILIENVATIELYTHEIHRIEVLE